MLLGLGSVVLGVVLGAVSVGTVFLGSNLGVSGVRSCGFAAFLRWLASSNNGSNRNMAWP